WDTSRYVAATVVAEGSLSSGLRFARLHGCGAVDGFAAALVSAAAADVAAHGIVDIGVGRVGFLGKQRHCGHDLSGLAIAALRNVFFHTGLLHWVAALGRKTFDGSYFLAGHAGDRSDAGARCFTVNVHGASPAERHAAPKLRAGQVQRVAQDPEQRHVRADVHRLCFAVQGETDGHGDLPVADRYPTTTTGQDENPQNLV